MIKGDLRKKQILETAEALFSERGYETTGVQDILDVLHLSKGSFYHHFESKEQVLRKICEKRAELTAGKMETDQLPRGLDRMNALLLRMIPFQGEGLTFLRMILPVFTLPEGKNIREGYQEALKKCWLPRTEEAFEMMIRQGDGYSPYPRETAAIALDLVNDLWAALSREMILAEKNRRAAQPAQLMAMVEPYRTALENLLSAPYGSIDLIQLEELSRVVLEIHDWWMIDSPETGDETKQEKKEEKL